MDQATGIVLLIALLGSPQVARRGPRRKRRPPRRDDVCQVCRRPECDASSRRRELWRELDRDPAGETVYDVWVAREDIARLIVLAEDSCERYRDIPPNLRYPVKAERGYPEFSGLDNATRTT